MSINTFFINLTVIIVIPAIIALVAVRLQKRDNRQLARETGDLKQRKLGLFIGNQEIHEREIWCYCFPKQEADKSIVVLDLQIVNTGDLTCDGVTMVIDTVKDLLSGYSPPKVHMTHQVYPSVLGDSFKRAVANTDDLHRHVSYTLPPIHPKSLVNIGEWLLLKQTVNIPQSVPTKTKDNKRFNVQYQMSLSWPMTLALVATDCEPKTVHVEIFGVQARSTPEALEQLFKIATNPSSNSETEAQTAKHHVRVFILKQGESHNIDNKSATIFNVDIMQQVTTNAPLTSLAMKPKVELLDIKPGTQRRGKNKLTS